MTPPILFEGYLRWYEPVADGRGWLLHCVPAPTISDLDRLAIDELDTAIVREQKIATDSAGPDRATPDPCRQPPTSPSTATSSAPSR